MPVMMTLLPDFPMRTAPIGAKLSNSLDPKSLKRIFEVFLILVTFNMLRKAYFG